MNYYPFHIGDYVSATRHLSWEEDAAFRRLLDTYYTTEKPIPLDLRQACRLVMAQTDSQREAVRVVLEEFFTKTEAGWINKRADAEIEVMRAKQDKQRDKANKRWNKVKQDGGNATSDAPALPRHDEEDAAASKSDANAMPPTPTPTPTPKRVARKRADPALKVPIPDDFAISDRVRQWAEGKGFGRLGEHLEAFRGKCLAKGYRYESWDDAFMEAIRTDWAGIRSAPEKRPVDPFAGAL